jgi:zinc protease
VAAEGVSLDRVEQVMDRVVHDLRENGVTELELERAKRQYIAEFVYESDSQSTLARRYGEALALGLSIEQVNSWPTAIGKVTLEEVKQVAAKYFDIRRSVTGTLIPAPSGPENMAAPPKQPPSNKS